MEEMKKCFVCVGEIVRDAKRYGLSPEQAKMRAKRDAPRAVKGDYCGDCWRENAGPAAVADIRRSDDR